MLSRAEAGEFDALVYYSTTRLTRRMKERLRIIDLVDDRAARRRPIRLRSVASGEEDLTTADGRMVAKIKGSAVHGIQRPAAAGQPPDRRSCRAPG